jgi:hypothetical protein
MLITRGRGYRRRGSTYTVNYIILNYLYIHILTSLHVNILLSQNSISARIPKVLKSKSVRCLGDIGEYIYIRRRGSTYTTQTCGNILLGEWHWRR